MKNSLKTRSRMIKKKKKQNRKPGIFQKEFELVIRDAIIAIVVILLLIISNH